MNFNAIINQYGYPALLSFSLSVIFVLVALWLFPKIGLMDRPWKYGLKRKPIPYYGGLAIYFAVLISVLVFVPLTSPVVGLLIGGSLIAAVGFFDDYFDLSPLVRLFVQFVATVFLVHFGVGILSINLPFLGAISFDSPVIYGVMIFSAAFTIVWVMTIINMMNFLDGVSGLNSSVAFVAGFTLFLLSVNPDVNVNLAAQSGVAMIALIVSMAALGFLIFDFPAPRLLMGDTGSTFLGFMLAALAIFSGGKVATAFLVLGIPILDMIWVVLRRVFYGQPFWKGDLKHLHHRLLDLGLKPRSVVIIYLIVSAIFGFTAVTLVSSQQKLFMLIGLVVLMVLLASALIFIPKKK